jgi:microcystin-dependent protein
MSYSTMNNVPTQSAGSSGVVASDWNTYVRDNFDAIKSGHVVCTSSTRPTGVDEGTMIYESDTQKVLIYNAGWVEVMDLDNTGAAPAALVPFLAPVGSIMQFAAASEPSGWVFCTGQELAIGSSGSTYYNLSQTLGTTYGALTNGSGGAGSTHFRVPNLSGRVPVGAGTGAGGGTTGAAGTTPNGAQTLSGRSLGAWFGDERLHAHNHTGSTNNTGGHTHSISHTDQGYASQNSGNGSTFIMGNLNGYNNFGAGVQLVANTNGAHEHTVSTVDAGAGTAQNMQPAIVLNYIIKY